MSWFWTDVNNGIQRLKCIDVIAAKCNYYTKSQKHHTSVSYSSLCKVTWGKKLTLFGVSLISHVICLGNGRVSLCLDQGWMREKWRWHKYVKLQPGSIYLAIGAKTSPVRNIIVYGTWLVYVTGKIPIRQTWCFLTGEKVPVIYLIACVPVTHAMKLLSSLLL